MAPQQKTPLSEAGTATPGRSQQTDTRSKVARKRLIAGGVAALVVVGAGAFLATRGGGDGILGAIIGDGDDRPVPEVTLTLRASTYDPTSAQADPDAQTKTAETVGKEVRAAIESMLRTAYVDPDTWDDARDVADSFAGDAADRVEDDLAVLALGPDAGDTYEYVEPEDGTIKVRVLTDAKGQPIEAFANVSFQGTAEHDDGTYTALVVDGAYFLVHEDDTWKITSYRVDRNEKQTRAPATATSSVTPSGEAAE